MKNKKVIILLLAISLIFTALIYLLFDYRRAILEYKENKESYDFFMNPGKHLN